MWWDWLTKWYKKRIDPREESFYKYRTPQTGGYKIIMSSSDFIIDENNIYSPIIVKEKNKIVDRMISDKIRFILDEELPSTHTTCRCDVCGLKTKWSHQDFVKEAGACEGSRGVKCGITWYGKPRYTPETSVDEAFERNNKPCTCGGVE